MSRAEKDADLFKGGEAHDLQSIDHVEWSTKDFIESGVLRGG
jgi:hypothetical protein